MDDIIPEFVEEALEGLETVDRCLLTLEESPDDTDAVTEVFRALHTIKGTCGLLGFPRLEHLAHSGETLFSLVRDGDIVFEAAVADGLLATVDAIRAALDVISNTGAEADNNFAAEIAMLEGLASTSQRRLGDVLVDEGDADRIDVEIAATEQQLGDDRKIGEILVESGTVPQVAIDQAASEVAAAKQGASGSSGVRVDIGLLDSLMNLVGELVLSRNQIGTIASDIPALAGPAHQLSLVTGELQDAVMKTRMQQIGSIWKMLPRVVRDISREIGKQVTFETRGEDTELDRAILEAIKDPLVHMVRNSVDHGIESPEARLAAGKPAMGQLMVSARHQGSHVVIEISDDGAGLDPQRLIAKAVQRGLISEMAAATMSDREAIRLIFAAGFSTAEKVSNISGRGVGMDVVRSNVERVGGTIEVDSVLGVGTSFQLRIPLTLAIIPSVTIRCGNEQYTLPQSSTHEFVMLERHDAARRIEQMNSVPVFRLRERLIPVIDLHDVLDCPQEADSPNVFMVIVESDGSLFALVVDEIERSEEIVVKPLGRNLDSIPIFSGATTMGDGRVSLILDVNGIARGARINAGMVSADENASVVSHGDEGEPLLVARLRDGSEVAIPLADVDRLEQFKSTAIEFSAGRPVVRYRGEVMSLVDVAVVTGRRPDSSDWPATVDIVVHKVSDGFVGFMVSQVSDIITDATLHDGALGEGPQAISGNRVIDIVDLALLDERLGVTPVKPQVAVTGGAFR